MDWDHNLKFDFTRTLFLRSPSYIVMGKFKCSVHFFRGPCPTPLTNVRKKSFRTKTPNQRKSISLPRLFNLSAKLELLGLSYVIKVA